MKTTHLFNRLNSSCKLIKMQIKIVIVHFNNRKACECSYIGQNKSIIKVVTDNMKYKRWKKLWQMLDKNKIYQRETNISVQTLFHLSNMLSYLYGSNRKYQT